LIGRGAHTLEELSTLGRGQSAGVYPMV
jgi:hypothetical protein